MLIKIFKMCQKNKNFECLKGSDWKTLMISHIFKLIG
jgi:hypothetical protein